MQNLYEANPFSLAAYKVSGVKYIRSFFGYQIDLAFRLHLCQTMRYHVCFFPEYPVKIFYSDYVFVWKKLYISDLSKPFLHIKLNSFYDFYLQIFCQSKIFLHSMHSLLFPNSGFSREGKCLQVSEFTVMIHQQVNLPDIMASSFCLLDFFALEWFLWVFSCVKTFWKLPSQASQTKLQYLQW